MWRINQAVYFMLAIICIFTVVACLVYVSVILFKLCFGLL